MPAYSKENFSPAPPEAEFSHGNGCCRSKNGERADDIRKKRKPPTKRSQRQTGDHRRGKKSPA